MADSLRKTILALRQVLANPDLRRALVAWMLGYATEGAWLVALLVFAYVQDGVIAVGGVGLARTLPAAVLSPALSTLTDRLPRHRVLLIVHYGRSAVMALAALLLVLELPAVLVYALAPLEGLFSVLHRPSHASLMPALARSPEDLMASNAASGTFEGIGTLGGPALAGVLVSIAAPAWSFVLPASMAALAALAVAGVRPAQQLRRAPSREGIVGVVLGGARALVEHPAAGLIVGLFFVQVIVRGLLAVLLVVAAVELLDIGEGGVGWLNAAIGVGGFIGALSAMGVLRHTSLAPAFAVSLVLWGAPIMVVGLIPDPPLAVGLLVMVGIGNAALDVAGYTIIQRSVPNAVRGRVFGVLESLVMLGLAIGSLLAPVLVAWLGPMGAMVATGAILPVAAVVTWPWVRRADAAGVIPARELALLRGVSMFACLPMTVLEQVAADLRTMHFGAGEPIIRQGEVGDRFYIVLTGEAVADVDGVRTTAMSAGDSFGEIALLRDVPRTATVTAIGDVEACVLDREAFVAAVSGDYLSRRAADQVIGRRLGEKA